jgi:hypothetical protein
VAAAAANYNNSTWGVGAPSAATYTPPPIANPAAHSVATPVVTPPAISLQQHIATPMPGRAPDCSNPASAGGPYCQYQCDVPGTANNAACAGLLSVS